MCGFEPVLAVKRVTRTVPSRLLKRRSEQEQNTVEQQPYHTVQSWQLSSMVCWTCVCCVLPEYTLWQTTAYIDTVAEQTWLELFHK